MYRRFGRLCTLYQPDNLGQPRLCAYCAGFQQQQAVLIHGARANAVARLFAHRQAFTRQHRLVHMAGTVADFGIHRDAFAGFDHDQVIDHYLVEWHQLVLCVTSAPASRVGAQGAKRAYGFKRLPFGAALQILAKQNKADNGCGSFVVERRILAGRGLQQVPCAQGPAGAGAQGNQQVHIAAAITQRMPGSLVEACAKDELHYRGKHQLEPGRQHKTVIAKEGRDHPYTQGQGKGDSQYQPRPLLAQLARLFAVLMFAGVQPLAGIASIS